MIKEEASQQTVPEKEFLVSPGPHLRYGLSVSKIMSITLLALMLPTAASIYFFGYYALSVIAVSVFTAIVTEFLVKKLRGRAFNMDGSAVVISLLLALTLPPTIPLWMVAIGAIIAIAIVKEAFGGLGHYIFNPALGGMAFMYACFPTEMTTWVEPMGFSSNVITTVSPLSEAFAENTDKISLFLGNTGGGLGETSALFILLGGIILIAVRIIDWRIPVAYIGTVALFSFALGQDAIFYILAGGLMLGAFFLATDTVTTPLTQKGRIIFGIGAGILLVLIRRFGSMPEGVAYSILLMNAVTPLIDRFIRLKPYGIKKVVKGEG
jgi:electron transport complex protein RnfD